ALTINMDFSDINMTERTNSSSICVFNEDFKFILLPVSYALVFVIGLAMNAAALYVIVFRTKRWKPFTIYMFNLTMCDMLYIFTLPFLIYYYADENDWPFSEPFCKLIRFLFYANLDVKTERICYDTTSPEHFDDFLVYSSVMSVLMFVLPFNVVMVCYSLMVRKLLEPGWGSIQGAEGEGGGPTAQRSKQKSVKMIIIVLAAFMLCFLPFHLTRSLYYSFRYLRQVNPSKVSPKYASDIYSLTLSLKLLRYAICVHQISCSLLETASVAYKVTRPLASANSCVDPILYFLAGRDARSNLTKKKKLSSQKPTMSRCLATKL
ncbi:hypothetical protein XENOCAPTIV_020783, partial [Xenoophorus captivus]